MHQITHVHTSFLFVICFRFFFALLNFFCLSFEIWQTRKFPKRTVHVCTSTHVYMLIQFNFVQFHIIFRCCVLASIERIIIFDLSRFDLHAVSVWTFIRSPRVDSLNKLTLISDLNGHVMKMPIEYASQAIWFRNRLAIKISQSSI